MKKLFLAALLFISIGSIAQVQYGGNFKTSGTVFSFSTVNSSSAQLAAAATFTGTVESVVSQQSYSVLFFSDQNATITIKQYIDAGGTKLVSSLVYTYTANAQFARSGVLNGNYCNVVVQNTGGSTTTTLALDVAYGTIPSATQLNNNPSAINEVNGTVVSTSTGATDAGTQRIMLANEAIQDLAVTGQSAQTATVNNILTTTAGTTATDLLGYRSASVQVVSTATGGTFIFEGSNDNTNFQTIPVYSQLILTGTPITAAITPTSSQLIYTFPVTFRYLRLRIATTITGGSIQAFSKFSQQNWTPAIFQVAQATAANLATTATIASGTVTTVTTLTTLANGQTAHSTASTGSPVRVGGRVVPTTAATVDATLVAGDAADKPLTTGQQAIVKNFGTSELDFTFHNTSVSTTTSLQQIIPASGTASVRNYVTGLTLQTDAIGAAGNIWVLDGQGAIGTSVTIATPGVFTSAAHDLKVGDAIVFTSLGTITGVSTNTVYYITATSFAATTFTIATTQGGTAIAVTGSTSAFTFYRLLYPIRIQTAAVGTPAIITFPTPLKGFANSATNLLIPSSLTSGNIYLTVNGYRGF